MADVLIQLIREKYKARLNIKYAWGHVDALAAFDLAVTEAILEYVNKDKTPE